MRDWINCFFVASTWISLAAYFDLICLYPTLSQVRQWINDVARIYSITVSNAVDGVSSSCRACALSTQPSSSTCVPCPAGHYIDSVNSQCTECPRDTRLVSHATPGPDACKPCGPASKSDKVCKSCKLFVCLKKFLLPLAKIIHPLLFVFLTGPQSVLQWLPLHPHRGQRHSHLRLQFPRICGNSDERTELYLQRDQIFPPVQH